MTDTDTPPKQVKPDDYRVEEMEAAIEHAAWLESEACKEWRETTIAGLRSQLAKTREKLRRAEAKKAKQEPAIEAEQTPEKGLSC